MDKRCLAVSPAGILFLEEEITEKPWFSNGLPFQCTGCGKCCTGSPGYVFLSPQDVSELAAHLKISEVDFLTRYTRRVDGQLCLTDLPQSDACVFLHRNRCSVYNARPVQCRTFPWWPYHLQSPETWQEAAKGCEGMNRPGAPIVSSEQIACQCLTYLDNSSEC